MSNEPDIDPGGQHVDGDNEAHPYYSGGGGGSGGTDDGHVGPAGCTSSRGGLEGRGGGGGEVVGRIHHHPTTTTVTFPQYMVADDSEWVQQLSGDVIYQDSYPFHDDLQNIGQHLDHTEEVCLLTETDRDMETMRTSVESLQVAANEVVIDDMLANTIEPHHQYVTTVVPEEVMTTYPQHQQYGRSSLDHHGQIVASRQMETSIPGTNRVHYVVQNASSTMEMRQNHSVEYEVRPMAMFEGPSNQFVGPPPPPSHPVSILRSRSKSQPRRPLYEDLKDESLAYLVQGYDEGEWDGVQLEDHEYFIGGLDEREAIIHSEDRPDHSNFRAPKTIQRPYFPPNLSPTEKKEYLLVNYKKACDRYFPFANVAVLEADTRYKPVEAFASDLYRFHSRGAHIHGFFRTVIDTRDRPSHDQTRYIQDIQFGKVFPLFPDYEEWDDSMRNEFRQLSNRLMQIFERKCFYANAASGHGRAPVIRRGPKPTQKPPPDYAEQQRILYKGIPRGFQPLRSSIATQMKTYPTKPSTSHSSSFATLPGSSSTMLKPVAGDASTSEPVIVPHELGTPRLEAYEHNKRANIKRLVNDAFANREQVTLQYEEPMRQRSSLPQSYVCRVPAGPSKTLLHQRSTASKAIRMITNRAIEPALDPATGRYVVALDDLRGLDRAATEHQRYVQRPVHNLREMADSARRGGGGSYNSWSTTGGRPQGARMSRIDQVPRSNHYATLAASQQNLPSSSGAVRAPFLTNMPTTEATRRPDVLTGNALSTTTSSSGRPDHVYPRSHSSGRRETPALNYRRSASSGRPITRPLDANSVLSLSDREGTSEQILNDIPINGIATSDPTTEIADKNQATDHQVEKTFSSLTSRAQSQFSEQNNAPKNVQVQLSSSATASQKPQKGVVLLRDEHGQLRRARRLSDGSLLIRERPPGNLISQLGWNSTESRGAEVQRPQPPKAGTVLDVQSIVGKIEKKPRRQDDQLKQSQAFLSSWNHSTSASDRDGSHQSQNLRNSDPMTQPKAKNSPKDVLYPDSDNEIVVITGKKRKKHDKNVAKSRKHSAKSILPGDDSTVVASKRRQRTPKLVSRLKIVNRTSIPAEQGSTLRGRVEPQEHQDNDAIVDVLTVDDVFEEAIRELIASVPPPESTNTKEEQVVRERKKLGRSSKKLRGKFSREKQAIPDAEIAEKVAIKQRELPVLDLTLKVIENSTSKIPIEAPIEYRNLNVLVAERSPPPPPLRNKPRGWNSKKYRRAVLERDKQQSEQRTDLNVFDKEGSSPLGESKSLNASQESVTESQHAGSENMAQSSICEQNSSLCSKSQSAMLSTLEEDFAFSGLEDFDVNEDDLVDINVDTFFT
ncbi:hypothetical protein KIN20_031824, partial [Parelaphostrongylus tenuis]